MLLIFYKRTPVIYEHILCDIELFPEDRFQCKGLFLDSSSWGTDMLNPEVYLKCHEDLIISGRHMYKATDRVAQDLPPETGSEANTTINI